MHFETPPRNTSLWIHTIEFLHLYELILKSSCLSQEVLFIGSSFEINLATLAAFWLALE